jgi:hypothetical protein
MTETQQRFLRAIAERVPPEQVVEVHLFPAIRQGGVETGVAVVAEDPRKRAPEPVSVTVEANGTADVATAHYSDAEPQTAAPAIDAAEVDASESVAELDLAELDVPEPDASTDATVAEAEQDDGRDDVDPPVSRFTIHTARYRLTLKGVDRGKWEVDVVAEADAPLDAVEAVVRGVQRRSGEGAEPDRLTTESFREALDAPLATLER